MAAVALAAPGCGDEVERSAPLGVPLPWLRAQPSDDGRSLRIGYENDPCTRARVARVEERDRTVTVALFDPERDPKQACIAVVEPGCVILELGQPLDGRRVLDGAPRSRRGRGDRRPFSRFGRCRPVRVDG